MDMIRRLHRKFIWMATASVVAIIVLAVGLINGSLYVRVHHEISSITDIISQNGGTIPSDLAPQEKGLFEFGNWAEETPEFSYQARYFSILFDANKRKRRSLTSTTSPHSTPKKPSTSLYGFSRQGNRKISSLKTGPITTIKSHRPPAVTPSSSFSTVPGTSSPSLPYSATPWRSVSSASSSSSSSSPSSPARPSSPS